MPKVNAAGKANWDIMVPSDTTEVKTEETPVETKEGQRRKALSISVSTGASCSLFRP